VIPEPELTHGSDTELRFASLKDEGLQLSCSREGEMAKLGQSDAQKP